ncbi:MAG: tetratricopeptide repeat protein [Gemmataceae bacterium]|nr:tetratricopeptide repeat protein [Gemmataceae bacterium]
MDDPIRFARRLANSAGPRQLCMLPCLLVLMSAGCASGQSFLPWKKSAGDYTPAAEQTSVLDKVAFWKKKEELPDGPKDSLVFGADGKLEKERYGLDPTAQADLDGARRHFQNKDYDKAETIFSNIAKSKKLPLPVLEEALYYEGESQRLQNNYRDAEATFKSYLKRFGHGQYAEQVNRKLFDIANYWLDDTRRVMQEYEEKREGKRYWVMPSGYFHWSKDKPTFDAEGHALGILEEVRLNDIRGPLGEKSLFYMATVKFFREDYRDADYYYTQLFENYPNSALAPKAIKQAIICKQITNNGPAYDTRVLEECRKILDNYARAYPQLQNDMAWMDTQLKSINIQQAERDFGIAEFYRRTGHPGSAYFYYELVRRRYGNTEFARMAVEKMDEIRGAAQAEQGGGAGVTDSIRRFFAPAESNPASAEGNASAPRFLPSLFGSGEKKGS